MHACLAPLPACTLGLGPVPRAGLVKAMGLNAHKGQVMAVAISPDNKRAATASKDGMLKVEAGWCRPGVGPAAGWAGGRGPRAASWLRVVRGRGPLRGEGLLWSPSPCPDLTWPACLP